MNRRRILCWVLVLVLGLAACGKQETKTDGISASAEANGFTITLYADKACYAAGEEIGIRATLEYRGKGDTVTIWHGDPYITFSITDGEHFQSGGLIMTILTSTELEKGKVYEFPYQKSGSYSEDDPDADFWREFYGTDALKLPAGTYTVTVTGAFNLSYQQRPEEKGPSASLQITVTD